MSTHTSISMFLKKRKLKNYKGAHDILLLFYQKLFDSIFYLTLHRHIANWNKKDEIYEIKTVKRFMCTAANDWTRTKIDRY